MSETVLAPSADTPGQYFLHPQTQESFADSSFLPLPIRAPPPCAQILRDTVRSAQAERIPPGRAHCYTAHRHDSDSSQQTVSGMFGSFSSGESGSTVATTPPSSVDLEKSSVAREQAPWRASRASRDPEKAMSHVGNESLQMRYARDSGPLSDANEEGGGSGGRKSQENNAIKILFFLSGPCVLLSALNTIWTCLSLFITVLSQPVRICARRLSFGQQLAGLLGPALNLQLRCIYTPLPPHANEDTSYHTAMLITVHLLSPFMSLGVMFMAWVLAAYWLCSAILGDPAGMDKRDDGRDTVLGLRWWWEKWLMRSIVES